jgi:hypothetical protein
MSKLIIILTLGALAISGCATADKTRSIDMKGVYISDSGKIAFGSVKTQSAQEGAEAAMISYTETMPVFSDDKERNVHITLSGANTCITVAEIVRDVCSAITAVAVTTNGVSAVK